MVQIRECEGRQEEEFFWEQLQVYFERDMFPDPEDEDRAYFLGSDYRSTAADMHAREKDRLRYLLFEKDGGKIGFVMAMIYDSEDARCFLMEFCVFPQYRGGGTGRACAKAFEAWALEQGAAYIELNAHTEQRQRFWHSVGYVDNGRDDWGDPSLMLPPIKKVGLSARALRRYDDWQLTKLVNGMRCEAGEEALSDEARDELVRRLTGRQISACVLRRGWRWVGICFVRNGGEIEEMYVEPVFRTEAAEDMLRRAARQMG